MHLMRQSCTPSSIQTTELLPLYMIPTTDVCQLQTDGPIDTRKTNYRYVHYYIILFFYERLITY